MQFYLLQGTSYFSPNQGGAIPVLIFLGILVLIGIIAGIVQAVRKGPTSTSSRSQSGSGGKRTFSVIAFNRVAKAYGLNRREKKLLSYVFRNASVDDPERVLQRPTLLDRYFKMAYHAITKSMSDQNDINERLSELFSLRNMLDIAPVGMISSTRQIEDDTPVMFTMDKKNFQSKVISTRDSSIVVACPTNNLGTLIRIPLGTRITVSFLTGINLGVSFETKMTETRQTPFGMGVAFPHTNKLRRLAQRKSRRKEFSMPCYFFVIITEQVGTGKAKKTKMTVDKQRIKAIMEDISAGGCSIKSPLMIATGTRLKIQLPYDDGTITCLGQVLRVSREAMRLILHIKFIKVPQKSYNAINALVFDFE